MSEAVEIDSISPPIDIASADERAVLFYLSGRVPLSVREFAEECETSESRLRAVLNKRFQNEVQTDQTDFIRVTNAARQPVLTAAKEVISDALTAQDRAETLADDGDHESAVSHYQIASKLLRAAVDRLSAVGDVPARLRERVASVAAAHDQLQKDLAKDTLTHRKLLAEQRKKAGDEAMQAGEYERAAKTYKKAIKMFSDAKVAVSEYNNQRLSDASSHLDTDPLDRRIEALERKYDSAAANASTPTATTQETTPQEDSATTADGESPTEELDSPDQDDAGPESDTVAVDSNGGEDATDDGFGDLFLSESAVIGHVRTALDDTEQPPTMEEVLRTTPLERLDIHRHFDGWEDALAAAEAADDTNSSQTQDTEPASGDVPANAGGETNELDSSATGTKGADTASTGRADSDSTASTQESTGQDETPSLDEYASFADLTPNRRFGGELAIKIEEQAYSGTKRDAAFEVSDKSGSSIRMDFWSKHDIEIPQSIGSWYVMSEVRLKEWEKDGETNQNLSSSRDTTHRRLDGATEEKTTVTKNIEVTDQSAQPESNEAPSASNETTPDGDSGNTDDGLLGSIEAEFDDDIV